MIYIQNAKTNRAFLNGDFSRDEDFEISVLIEGKKITKINPREVPAEATIIDAQGKFLMPGLMDPQVHFREPGMEYKEDLKSGSMAAAKGGFTRVLCMPNTSPALDNAKMVEEFYNKANDNPYCELLTTACVTEGLQGKKLTDFRALKEAGVTALTDDGKGIQDDDLFHQACVAAREVGLAILDHSEDETLSAGGAIHAGIKAKEYEVKGIDPRSEAAHVKRGVEESLKTGVHFHVLHVSTAESIKYIREGKAKGAKVTAEVSPHHLLLCDEDIPYDSELGSLDPNFKMNPPLRSKSDREACIEALLDGTIDCIATDHAPHSIEEKQAPIEKAPFGIIGLETAFSLLYTNFVVTQKLTLTRLVELMSFAPVKMLGLQKRSIRVGDLADLVLVDLEKSWKVTTDEFQSKSSNSPFIGRELKGVIERTFCQGFVSFTR